MTARVLSAVLLAMLLAGCGGDTRVCAEWNWPDYCQLPPPPTTTLTLQNACAYPVPVAADGVAVDPARTCTRDRQCGTAQRCQVSGANGVCVWTLPAPATGGSPLQPGEAATFRLPRDPEHAAAWSGVVYSPAGAGRAELTLRNRAPDAYALRNDGAIPLTIQPGQETCTAADAEHPGPHACRGASDYAITFCAQSEK